MVLAVRPGRPAGIVRRGAVSAAPSGVRHGLGWWISRAGLFRSAGLLVIAAVLPLLVFGALGAVRSVHAEHLRAEAVAVDDARLLSTLVDQELLRALDDVQDLAQSPALDHPGDLTAFRTQADRLMARHPLWLDVILLDPDTGRWVLQSPQGKPGSVVDRPSLAVARASLAPVIGDIAGVHQWGLPVRAPVIRGGKLLYIATIVIRPAEVQEVVKGLNAPPSWIVTVSNQYGHIVARSARLSTYIGHAVSPSAQAARRRGGGGLYEGYTLEGLHTVSAYWMSPATGWSVHIGVPKSDFEAHVHRSILLLGIGFVLSLLLAGFFCLLLLRDLRVRRGQASALEQVVRLEALGRLTGGVAHDFNNLLMIIQGNTDILRRRIDDPQVLVKLDAIRTATDRGARMIRQMLAFARGGDWESAVVDLNGVVGDLAEQVRQLTGPQVRVDTRLAAAPVLARVDRTQLEAAILNLATNARDAMPGGGVAELFAGVEGDVAAIGLRDTGEGMTPEVLARVFEPFFTTKPPGWGSGLGLAQVYGVARNAGGEAIVESRPGQGTTVTLRFPQAAAS